MSNDDGLGAQVVGIVGTGLIGGSIGLRVRRNGARALGYDPDPAAITDAISAGAIDAAVSRERLYAESETVVIAAHLDATLAEIAWLRAHGPARAALVVDVASVKAPVCAAAAGLPQFVATHPMAGSERTGALAASAALFEGRTWAYVSSGDARMDARASQFITWLGAIPLAVDPQEHDRIVAFTSHLPQLVAWAYAGAAPDAADERAREMLAGSVSRELARLGRSGFAMWRSVLRANAANVEPGLRRLAGALLEADDFLQAGEIERLDSMASPAGGIGARVVDARKAP